ncbi:MAG: L-glutamate gamma-semialdehyde dehydrogenase [Bacteroidetes bacterium]|nr:L-glutamate gamma-semialdehyde dehydrogenase [Bacteroidota bacterium]
MNNAILNFREPLNEPVKQYLPGSTELQSLQEELHRQSNQVIEIPLIIGGKEVFTGVINNVVMPHDHGHILARCHQATEKEVKMAIDAALEAKTAWMNLSWVERSSIMLKAAELLSTKYRNLLNAATMLGQSKNIMQAEIDSACESIDFLRFNTYYASKVYSSQPLSANGAINRVEHRPLEGFVYTITPFNFTSIALNLNTSVAQMGNTTVWKPATAAVLSNYYLMKVLMEAGLPDGVINFVPGPGSTLSNTILAHPQMAGIHFTGSNVTFNRLWRQITDNLEKYRSYPKIVGETGGKDFIFVHQSADALEVATAIVRGSFEFQGQKCSAASRSYVAASLWPKVKELILGMVSRIKMGDVNDKDNFVNAVIDEKAFNSIKSYIDFAKDAADATIVTGGVCDKSKGYFVTPTIIETTNPQFKTLTEEIFGPVMTVYVYEDAKYEETLKLCDATSPYALTGAIFSRDRYAMMQASDILRYSAGNFYLNDKPTGAMVGQQPFGGARGSGTNDKAGSELNLIRWVSPRTIKETLVAATDFPYPYMSK